MEMRKSYAKINLGLSVVRKTRRNYHKLKMIMCQIDLYDEVYFYESDEILVETDKKVCEMEQNLCYKVAAYLKKKYDVPQGVKIFIKKNIPDGGGLGGGSSNAATVLKYLNKKWNLGLSDKKLKKIGFMFGCDIPFFIDGNISYVYSYGEKMKGIKVIKKVDDILLVVPGFKNSTKTIFENHEIVSGGSRKVCELIKGLKKGDYKNFVFNDLERTANEVSQHKMFLIMNKLRNAGCNNVIMTGSGSTLVCFMNDQDDAAVLCNKIKKELADCKVVASTLKMY